MYTNGYMKLKKYIVLSTNAEEGRKDRISAKVILQGRHLYASTYTFYEEGQDKEENKVTKHYRIAFVVGSI